MSLVVKSQLGLAERLGVKALDDCGPASLATAATYLGLSTSTKQGWDACRLAGRVDTPDKGEGTSAKQVRDAAKVLGLGARIVYEWAQVSSQVKAGAALILNIQASTGVLPDTLRSKWQRADWRKHPQNSYGHWVVMTHNGVDWFYACPTMVEGEPGRVLTPDQVRALRDSKGQAGFSTPPAMVVISRKEA